MSPSQIFSNIILARLSHQISSALSTLSPSFFLQQCGHTLLITRIKCASDVLLYHQFSFSTRRLHNILETGPEGLIQITRFKHDKEEFRVNVCAVCLGEVEEGEEIRELRCSHVFHQLCLERWIRFKHTTCPLCHGSLAPTLSAVAGEEAGFGVEVVFFKFCSFGSNIDDVRDTWWLR